MDTFKPGDVCIYSFAEQNKSCALVEIVRILNDERGVAEVKFLEVMVDDTGNGYFNYLLRTGGTMNASFKYLRKEDPDMNENGKRCAELDYKAEYENLKEKSKLLFDENQQMWEEMNKLRETLETTRDELLKTQAVIENQRGQIEAYQFCVRERR